MSQRFPFSILPPSLGDQLLAGAATAELKFYRQPGQPTECSYLIRGSLPSAGGAAIAAALAREFRNALPAQDDLPEEGGVA